MNWKPDEEWGINNNQTQMEGLSKNLLGCNRNHMAIKVKETEELFQSK